jgi:hypothetical protein
VEKCYEHDIDIHNIFIDYTHSFDSVKRNKMIECLFQYRIPVKLITLIKLTLEKTRAKVKVNNKFTEEFQVEYGVKQGDPLSATLFSMVIDVILKNVDLRGNISTRLKQCIANADDVLIAARTRQTVKDTFQQLMLNSIEFGLIINKEKTKNLKGSKKETRTDNLNIDNTYLEQVKQFKYLGSIINNDNTIEEEIKERIALGNKAYFADQKFLKSKLVTKRSKLKLYKTVIRPVLIHGSETWVLKEAIIQKLMLFERRFLRRIFGPTKEKDGTWRIKTNEELDYLIKHNNIINQIRV